jgi:predicted HicB family RNase H-like nuclease
MGKHGNLEDLANRQTEKSNEARQQVEEAATEDTKRLNANVPEPLHRAVRMEAARRGVDMKTVMVEALTEYLPNYPNE